MAITQAMATSFKKELLEGKHNFLASGGNSFKLALYTSSATMGAATTAFTTTNQASGTNYTSGGAALTNINPTSSGTTAFTDFADLTFGTATAGSPEAVSLKIIHPLAVIVAVPKVKSAKSVNAVVPEVEGLTLVKLEPLAV